MARRATADVAADWAASVAQCRGVRTGGAEQVQRHWDQVPRLVLPALTDLRLLRSTSPAGRATSDPDACTFRQALINESPIATGHF